MYRVSDYWYRGMLGAVVLISLNNTALAQPLEANLKTEAIALVQEFAGQLKPQLQQAIAAGGPVHAIETCATLAPKIAADLSATSGWSIKRVSNKNRNRTATPDEWESAAINTLEQRLANGADPTSLTHTELTPQRYRFAKAQVTEPMCLMCHGQTITPEVKSALTEYYPHDMATGYKAGEIRGIFSLIKEL